MALQPRRWPCCPSPKDPSPSDRLCLATKQHSRQHPPSNLMQMKGNSQEGIRVEHKPHQSPVSRTLGSSLLGRNTATSFREAEGLCTIISKETRLVPPAPMWPQKRKSPRCTVPIRWIQRDTCCLVVFDVSPKPRRGHYSLLLLHQDSYWTETRKQAVRESLTLALRFLP